MNGYIISRPDNFDLAQIFDCGQCFRFESVAGCDDTYEGVAFDRYIRLKQSAKTIELIGADKNDCDEIWRYFLSVDSDYSEIQRDILCHFNNDSTISSAMRSGRGIRILHQDPWETVCSFIISQNNNIPRIKKIISSLSEKFGKRIDNEYGVFYSFPSPQSLYEAGIDEIFALKTGFRAAYIYDAARKVAEGELDLKMISEYDTPKLLESLMSVKGIGPKVASCAALFGFGKTDAFPVDVWVKKVISKYYPNGLDINSLGEYAGIAQQYLFYYERYLQSKL